MSSVTSKKSPNVYKNVSNLGKIIVATGFECLPKKQKIVQSDHTAHERQVKAPIWPKTWV